MTIKTISEEKEFKGPARAQGPDQGVDRLADLLPEEALEDALKGLRPEEWSAPGSGDT